MSSLNVKNIKDYQKEISELDNRYKVQRVIGCGSYGIVFAGIDTLESDPELQCVAIKRINKEIFEESILARRILREIKLLNHFHDENIIRLRNLLTPKSENFEYFYIVTEYMEADLKQVLRSGQKLEKVHVQFFMYQALHALFVIHAAGALHRDITPSNLLVNENCTLKVCDFGLARQESTALRSHQQQKDVSRSGEDVGQVDDDTAMSDYVCQRWYRAPEIVMEGAYSTPSDVWSLGCIMGELLGSRPLCQGEDRASQLVEIIKLIGTPTDAEISKVGSKAAQRYLRARLVHPPIDFKTKFPNACDDALDLLRRMLTFDPDKRITVVDAMRHPFFSGLYEEKDIQIEVPLFYFEEQKYRSVQSIKSAIYEKSLQFHSLNAGTDASYSVSLANPAEESTEVMCDNERKKALENSANSA